jgi:hypothetical protein
MNAEAHMVVLLCERLKQKPSGTGFGLIAIACEGGSQRRIRTRRSSNAFTKLIPRLKIQRTALGASRFAA